MTIAFGFRNRRGGFSAIYGAFGVVLASAAVMGGVVASMHAAPADPQAEGDLAAQFLDALLASNIDNATTLRQAISESCFETHCSRGLWNASSLRAALSELAGPLGRSVGRAFMIGITAGNLTQLRVGPAAAAEGGATATAEVFRPRLGDFVGVSLLLSPL